jgi:hypothetical protein
MIDEKKLKEDFWTAVEELSEETAKAPFIANSSRSLGIIELHDGRKAQIQICIEADEMEWMSEPK